ncbi:MAG: leucine-rich repeat protein [Muribaculaceae bacterium]|nr:leucine-rich repeat protein [Muribaculaceae bacterium]
MKKLLQIEKIESKFTLLLGLLLLFCAKGWAYDFESGGLYYNIIGSEEIEVTYGDPFGGTPSYTGNLVIPEKVTFNGIEYSVTSIGSNAFSFCQSLVTINLPDSLTSIGNGTFYECISLTSIEIPNSVISIEFDAFSFCQALVTINLPDSLTYIGDNAFRGCYSIITIDLPDSLTSIGETIFSGCSSLETINVGKDNLYFSSLNGVLFNKDMTSLILYPQGKKGSEYTVPESVISIANYAFSNCSSLISIDLPDSLTSIGETTFYGYYSLETINVGQDNLYFSSLDGVLFNKDMTSLILYPQGKRGSEYTIPESVISIANYAFSTCRSLISIDLPDSLTSIGDYAFSNCGGLVSIELPDSLTSIGDWAFNLCQNLVSINLPNSLTSIGAGAFNWCENLVSIDLPDSLTSIGDYAFSKCSSLVSINLPDSLTSIGNYAFTRCENLVSIVFPNSLTSIGDATLYECVSLESIKLPNSLTSIGNSVFVACVSLQSIDLPDSVTSIGKEAFYQCGLESIELPASLNSIGEMAFGLCFSLKEVICKSSVVPELSGDIFSWLQDDVVLYVYESVLEDFENSDWAQYFTEILPISDVVEVSSIKISPEGNQEMTEGDTLVFTATVLPENATDATVVWTTDDEDVISIKVSNENPNMVTVTALEAGETTLTATAADGSGVSTTITITVVEIVPEPEPEPEPTPEPVTSIQISPAGAQEMIEGTYFVFTANVLPDDATDSTVVWSTDNENIIALEVSKNKPNQVTVTALKAGKALLTATAADGSGVSTSVGITVVEPVQEPEPEPNYEVINKYDISYSYAENGVVLEEASIKWKSDGELYFNLENSIAIAAINSNITYYIETIIENNTLILDFSYLPVGIYQVTVPEAYVLIGENGINGEIEFSITIEEASGIAGIYADADGYYNVYKVSGEKVLSTKDASKLKNLENGIYIINGKKVMLRK